MKLRVVGLVVLAAARPAVGSPQTSPFLPDRLYRDLANEISGDRAFEHVRHLSHYHRTAASRDFFSAAEYIRGAAEAAGLEDVQLVRQGTAGHAWSCLSGEAWLLEPEPVKLAAYGAVAVSVADNSRTTHATAELVDVGAGSAEADYVGKEVKGRVVLASGSLGAVMAEAVWKRGALGILSHLTNRPENLDAPDQVAWGRLPYAAKDVAGVKDDTPSTFAVMVSPRRGRWLQKQLGAAGRPLKVKVDIESAFPEKPEQALVEGWIKGTEVHDQQIVLTAHIQEEMTSANDDGSGCGSMLEIGRALARMIKDGTLPRPRRDLRFWWVNELDSEPTYFRENPKEPRKMLLNLNQDMVGARQSWGGRVQYASRLPWSLPHALDDVMEGVLTLVRDGNTSLLTARGTGVPQPFPREIVAIKGSREPYHARMVPYFDSTDHHAFTPARIGVPGTSLTNWPDEFIHSTGDELDNIDATQLQRNAVVVAAVALYFGALKEEDAGTLAGYVAACARGRLAQDLAAAIAHVASAAPNERARAYAAARNLLRQGTQKEAAAVGSVRRLAGRGRATELVAWNAEKLEGGLSESLESLERAYVAAFGQNPPNLDLTKEERAMTARVFVPTADLATADEALRRTKPAPGLHPMMAFEALNFADGRRNAYEVYEAVAAEALSAGEPYYGTVSPADVLETLERAVKAGAYTVKGK